MLIGGARQLCEPDRVSKNTKNSNTRRELYLLPPQFYSSSSGYIAGGVEASAGQFAAAAIGDEVGGEGVVELPCSHLAFVLSQVYHFEGVWEVIG
jgi:hypothetical protein